MGQHEKRRASVSGSSTLGDKSDQEVAYLEPFIHQVGGHVSMLCWNDRTICKPYSSRERHFYEKLVAALPSLLCYVPEFRGVVEVALTDDGSGYLTLAALQSNGGILGPFNNERSGAPRTTKIKLKRSGSLELEPCGRVDVIFQDAGSSVYSQNPWSIHCQTAHIAKLYQNNNDKHQFLLLQNLVYNYRYPCILDLKMGTRLYGDDAPEKKRKAQTIKSERSTSSRLGTRMCGMQVYQKRSGVFKCHNKYYGRTLSVEGFQEEIKTFLHNGETYRFDLMLMFIQRLRALLQVLELADGYRFYSSSLLLLYDGALESDGDRIPQVDVRMIDFEHSTFRGFGKDPVYEGPDRGYIFGVNSVIKILSEILEKADTSVRNDSFDAGCRPLSALVMQCDSSDSSMCCSTEALATDDSVDNF